MFNLNEEEDGTVIECLQVILRSIENIDDGEYYENGFGFIVDFTGHKYPIYL
jgi:hypothetical protein